MLLQAFVLYSGEKMPGKVKKKKRCNKRKGLNYKNWRKKKKQTKGSWLERNFTPVKIVRAQSTKVNYGKEEETYLLNENSTAG